MAGEIGHIIYAARALAYLDDKVNHPSFWLGTIFPDIRHLRIITRQPTHTHDVSLETLIGHNDFETGMRVHSWIDLTHNFFFREMNVKERLPWHPLVPLAFNLLEDEILYDQFDDWNLIIRVLNNTHDDELRLIESERVINQWHSALQQYFQFPPNDATRHQLALDIGLSDNIASEINTVARELKTNPATLKLIDKFLIHLEFILS